MKKLTIIITYIFFGVLLILQSSCDDEVEVVLSKGDLYGYVYISDDSVENASGVIITLEDSVKTLETTSATDGKYSFSNVQTGTYNLIFKKEGYATHRINNFSFIGGSEEQKITQDVGLFKLPDTKIDSVNYGYEWDFFTINIFYTNEVLNNNDINFRIFISNTPDVSYKNYHYTFDVESKNLSLNYYVDEKGKYVFMYFDDSELEEEGYMIVYPAANLTQSYKDINTGVDIYTGIETKNPSKVYHYKKQ